MNLPVEDLTPDAFEPFGEVLQPPSQAEDAGGAGWRWWGQVNLLPSTVRPYAIGLLDLQPAPLAFDWAERHMHSSEVIIPTQHDCLVYVGPPLYFDQPERMPDLGEFRVFLVKAGRGVLLREGVWHGAPMAVDRPLKVFVLLPQDTGIVDASLVRFPENPVRIVLDTGNIAAGRRSN